VRETDKKRKEEKKPRCEISTIFAEEEKLSGTKVKKLASLACSAAARGRRTTTVPRDECAPTLMTTMLASRAQGSRPGAR
jgi:hypothetical protein